MTPNKRGDEWHFFAEGNTARGSVHLFDSSLQDLERIYILKGGPGSGKSTLIEQLSTHWLAKGYDAWLMHCARDDRSLDGVVFPQLKVGIVDGTRPHVIEPRMPGIVEQYIDLCCAWDRARLNCRKVDFIRMFQLVEQRFEQAYAGFAEALRVHDEWEAIYISHMDFAAADELTEQTIARLLGDRKQTRTARVDRRFLGAATPRGAVDFVPNLTSKLEKRYFLKGRPGSGKSTLLKKLAAAAQRRGFDVEIYHCGFDPQSVDMVIVRELGFAVFDSTKPHEYDPEKASDEIIDMYEACIHPGTDERYAEQIHDIATRYSQAMKRSIDLLSQGRKAHLALEEMYRDAINYRIVDQVRIRLEKELEQLTANHSL